MDFNLNDEQRQIYESGAQLAQRFDNAYWLDHARRHLRTRRLFAGLANLQTHQHAGDGGAQVQEHTLEQRERFGFEFVQRIALRVTAQMDHRAQMVEQ